MLPYASQTSAALITNAAAIPHVPETGLIGRDRVLMSCQRHLQNDSRLLITGERGIGKSALAATLATQYIVDQDDTVLWLWAADCPTDELFEAMVRPFRQQRLIAGLGENARIQFLSHLLEKSTIRCVVIDNVRHLYEIDDLILSIPPTISLIITSRHANNHHQLPVTHLLPLHLADSIALLHACGITITDRDVENNVEELCQLLAGNPYLVQIMGKTLVQTQVSLDSALEFISTATTPLVETVIEYVLSILDANTRHVVSAFRGFFAPDMSVELVALCDVEWPAVTDVEIEQARSRFPISMPIDDSELGDFLIGQAIRKIEIDETRIQSAMSALKACGIVEEIPTSDQNVPIYRIHDVMFDVLRNAATEEDIQRGVEVCLMLLRRHNEPQLANFAALRPLLKNMQSAAQWAMAIRQYDQAERFGWDLYANSQFLDYRGYYAIAIHVLTIAVVAAQQLENPHNQAAHLRHLGICYLDMGDKVAAAGAFHRAATIFHDIGDIKSEATTLAALGDTYRGLRYFDRAIDTYQKSLQISRDLEDAWGQSKALSNLGRSYRRMGQYEQAIQYIEESLAMCREIVDVGGESNMLRYLGNIYRETGDTQRAVQYYMSALTLVRDIGDRKMEANILGNLGEVYKQLGQMDRADEHFSQAYYLYQDIEDLDGVIEIVTKIAQLAFVQKDFEKAIHYFAEARDAGQKIGDIRQEAVSVWSMATVYEASGDAQRAEVYFNEVQALYEALELGETRREKS